MAIIIPSKNIYEKNHNKIRDNVIDNIEIDGTEVVPDNHYEEVVYSTSFPNTDNRKSVIYDKIVNVYPDATQTYIDWSGSFYTATFYYYDIEITIPKEKGNSYIEKIFNGEKQDDKEYPTVGVSYIGYKITKEASGTITNKHGSGSSTASITSIGSPTQTDLGQLSFPISGTTINNLPAPSNIKNETSFDITAHENHFTVKCHILSRIVHIYTSGAVRSGIYDSPNIPITGKIEEYETQSVQLTFYGNTIGIDLVDKTVKIGSGNHPFSIGGSNELLQTSNYLNTVDCKAIDKDYKKTLTEYSNGKETATLLCSISDYYDDSGNKVIAVDNSTNRMCFRMYDIVEPYVFGANGQDKPLSKNKDGSPKQFQVLGVKPIYDGAVWQELTLQEV